MDFDEFVDWMLAHSTGLHVMTSSYEGKGAPLLNLGMWYDIAKLERGTSGSRKVPGIRMVLGHPTGLDTWMLLSEYVPYLHREFELERFGPDNHEVVHMYVRGSIVWEDWHYTQDPTGYDPYVSWPAPDAQKKRMDEFQAALAKAESSGLVDFASPLPPQLGLDNPWGSWGQA